MSEMMMMRDRDRDRDVMVVSIMIMIMSPQFFSFLLPTRGATRE
jgi:hypothetical protein